MVNRSARNFSREIATRQFSPGRAAPQTEGAFFAAKRIRGVSTGDFRCRGNRPNRRRDQHNSSIQSALRAGDYEQALTLAHTQLQLWPKDVKFWTLEGIALSHLGHDRKALVAYNKALAMSPNYLAALEGAAELEYKAGTARAVPLLNRILKVRPDEPTGHAMLAAL